MSEPDAQVAVGAEVILEGVADEALRTTQVIAALEAARVPLDGVTAVALDHVSRHLSAALEAVDEQKQSGFPR